ncbi:MAG: malto-oligosyltrehalose synthase [Proteobacteria bacterium]|nr:malto-oligosyltrehalose synthase [Pseudomonadota bacterium]
MIPPLPLATYRLQFNSGFTFADAERIVPYLHALGISHCYASLLLKARSGSSHCYDIVDHNALNPELGTAEEFRSFVETLHAHDMGLILDFVPNHMGIGGSDNGWWLDVLENGPASPYAAYFDIDWHPQAARIFSGKVLLPILGDYYGNILSRGEIELAFAAEQGEFAAHYYGHRLPIDPKTYPQILGPALSFLKQHHDAGTEILARLQQLLAVCRHLPGRQTASRRRRAERRERQAAGKGELALLAREKTIQEALAFSLALFNAPKDSGEKYALLHRLLEKQPYRLAFWKVATDEINYRRFFNINTLAGLRQEEAEVFAATHRFLFSLVEQGFLQGLRIDHPDGLFNPQAYYDRLSAEIRRRLPQAVTQGSLLPSFYLVAEKILAIYEGLPKEWPIHGTTGYDFASLLNGLFVSPEGEKPLTRAYQLCTGRDSAYEENLYAAKRLIIKAQLAGELAVLANLLRQIAEQDFQSRDFTLTGLREALTEVVACFPVYRTYVTPAKVSEEDRRYVDWAVADAKQRNPMTDPAIFDFVRDCLLLARIFSNRRGMRSKMARFAMKFQQYTAPVMAKAQEDTLFYRDCRLLSLNEVGGDPRRFSVSRTAFHQANQARRQHWPRAMLATSTHDSKRSEDVRARINLLSEIPDLWKQRVRRWQRHNRRHARRLRGHAAPSRNEEYHLYQTLLGTWPIPHPAEQELARYRERITAYMLKAVREAKEHSSWLNPDPDYEEALASFVTSVLRPGRDNLFLADFSEFCEGISRFGLLNSLSQLLLKLTSPGVPDIYQGNELWDFSLVDPDNRHPVDFLQAQHLLGDLAGIFAEEPLSGPALASLLATLADGRAKLFVTSRTLHFRRKHPALFAEGAYEGLAVHGEAGRHLCVLARSLAEEQLIAVAPRFFASLLSGHDAPYSDVAETVWGQTCISLPDKAAAESYRDIFTGEMHHPIRQGSQDVLPVSDVLRFFPLALLYKSH